MNPVHFPPNTPFYGSYIYKPHKTIDTPLDLASFGHMTDAINSAQNETRNV